MAEQSSKTRPPHSFSQKVGNGSAAVGEIHGDLKIDNHRELHFHGPIEQPEAASKHSVPSLESIQAYRAALRDSLEREASRFLGDMSGFIPEDAVRLPLHGSVRGAVRQRDELVPSLLDGRFGKNVMVLGEPGSGKTVALRRLAWDLCGREECIVPVLVELRRREKESLENIVYANLSQTGHLHISTRAVGEALLRCSEVTFFFLFDGLNELPQEKVRETNEQLVMWMKRNPQHKTIITSRIEDENTHDFRQLALMDETVRIEPIPEPLAVNYLEQRLGPGRGREYWEGLTPHIRELAGRPLILWMLQCIAEAPGEGQPTNRGELYKYFVDQMLARDHARILALGVEDVVKTETGSVLAYAMHSGKWLDCRESDALRFTSLPEQGLIAGLIAWICRSAAAGTAAVPTSGEVATLRSAFRSSSKSSRDESVQKRALDALITHGFMVRGDRHYLSFYHQSFQEYFVGAYLGSRLVVPRSAGILERWGFRVQRLLMGRRLSRYARDDWWSEPLIMLAGLLAGDTDGAALVDWCILRVAASNPWLAQVCLADGVSVGTGTREAIDAQTIRLLRSDNTRDRRRAVRSLASVNTELTNLHLIELMADEDEDVSQSTIEYLEREAERIGPLFEAQLAKAKGRLAAARYSLMIEKLLYPELRWDQLLPVIWPSVKRRMDAGNVLGRLGDPRFASKQTQDRNWVTIPACEVVMGTQLTDPNAQNYDSDSCDRESPVHGVQVAEYCIGRYPVTVCEYHGFVEDGGYENEDLWIGGGSKRFGEPVEWEEQKNYPNRPVTGVSWYEAVAYAAWAKCRLPTEAEWERVARGPGCNKYPWGNKEPDSTLLNFRDSNIGNPTPVGIYHGGSSSDGCMDMAGNAWEWCSSLYRSYPYRVDDGRENMEGLDSESRVLHGGSFHSNSRFVRGAFRSHFSPNNRDTDLGFRIVASPFSSSLNSGKGMG